MDLYGYLARAENRIAGCELGIAHQERRIAGLARDGFDTISAKKDLASLREAEQAHRDYRTRLLAKIYEQEAAGR